MYKTLIFSKNNKIPLHKKKVLIGQWLLSDKEKESKNMKALRHLENPKKKRKNFIFVKQIYNRVLKNLTPVFNHIHKKNYKEEEWEILLSYLLFNFIFFAYSRWIIIERIKKNFRLYPIEIFNFSKNFFIEDDTQSTYNQFKTENWEDWLFSKIIKSQKINYKEKNINLKKKLKKNFDNLKKLKLQKTLLPKNNNNYFLKNLALPKKIKLRLNLNLNKNVRFHNELNFKRQVNNSSKRNLFQSIKTKNKFEQFIYDTLSEIFPRSFIENFNFIEKNIDYLNWPQNPKIIFTSFQHYFDDIFKIYTIKKKRDGAKLYLLQHGHQNLESTCFTANFEKRICERYFTWGSKSLDAKTTPLFCTSSAGKTLKKKTNQRIILSYTEFFLKPWKSTVLPRIVDETQIYRNDILNLIKSLNKNLQNKVTLKYNTQGSNYITDEIKKRFKQLNFIKTDLKKRGFQLSCNYKLNIETVNSTGFLELLSLNIPVILVTNKKFYNVEKKYQKYFNVLIKSNIIFFDVKKASNFINNNINNLDEWWFNKNTQKKINYFCENICKYEGDLDDGFNRIFNEIR